MSAYTGMGRSSPTPSISRLQNNKRPHESVDYIAHSATTKSRNAAPSDVDMVEARLSSLHVVNNTYTDTSGSSSSSAAMPIAIQKSNQNNLNRMQPLSNASPTQLAAANAARRRAKSAQTHTTTTSQDINMGGLVNSNNSNDSNKNNNQTSSLHQDLIRQQSVPSTKKEKSYAPRPGDGSTSQTSSDSEADRERDLPSGASFSVQIDTRETRIDQKSGNKYTVYKLNITVSRRNNGINRWYVWHRYSEFVDFRSQLRKHNIQVTHLPPKTWQSNFLDTFLDARQYALANWVAQLPSIFLLPKNNTSNTNLGNDSEDTIRLFLISSNMMKSNQNGDGEGMTSNPSTPSPIRGKTTQPTATGIAGLLPNQNGSGGSNGNENNEEDNDVDMGNNVSGGNNSRENKKTGRKEIKKNGIDGIDASGKNYKPKSTPERLKAQVTMINFEMLKVLGKGSYGKVILVRKRDGKDAGECYAMKVLKKRHVHQKRQVEHTKTERNVLASIKHPFIVKLHYAFQTGEKLHFVLTYASGGELFFHLQKHGRFPPKLALFYTAELTMAFGELHSRAVVFRDLKPENVLIGGDGHVLLADFGLSKGGVNEPESGTKSFCGTPEYLAPEVLAREGHGFAVDWWGLGALLYEMLTGLPPWYSRDRQKMFASIRSDPLIIPNYVAPEIQSLIVGLLDKNPKSRLGGRGSDANEIMNHSIFRYVGWEQLYEKRVIPPWKPGDPSSKSKNESSSDGGDKAQSGIGQSGIGGPNTIPFSPDTSNFEDTFTNMPVMSVGSEDVLGNMLEKTTRTSTFDGFSYVDDAHTNTLLEWGASREAAKSGSNSLGNSLGSSLGGSPGRRSGSRSPQLGHSPTRNRRSGSRSPQLGHSPTRNSNTYSTSPSRLRNSLRR